MIARHIAELLYDHECVVVPGFGGFIKSFSTAFIHTKTNEIFPPKGKIAFNVDLSINDGLLANYIAKVDNTTYREALFEISTNVELWHQQLKSGAALNLAEIGTLFLNKSGHIEFNPDFTANFNTSSYGLSAVQLKARQSLTPDFGKLQDRPESGKSSKLAQLIPATLKWAAVLAPFIAFTLWGSLNQKTVGNYVQNYSGMFSWASVTPGKTAPPTISRVKPVASVKHNKVESPASILFETGSAESPAAITFNKLEEICVPEVKENIISYPLVESETNYHIIGGAFRDFNNAMALIAHLKTQGYSAAIIDTTAKGLFMVSIKGVSSYSDAQQQLRAIKSAGYSSAWVFKLRKS